VGVVSTDVAGLPVEATDSLTCPLTPLRALSASGKGLLSSFQAPMWVEGREIYVTPTLFPDFRRTEIFNAIIEYQKRDRRFGDVKSK